MDKFFIKSVRLVIFVIILISFTNSLSIARHRSATYIDDNGVRRVVKTGRIYRDYAAIKEFKKMHPKPNDDHAYDINHIIPLACGGADKPNNMQWIRVEDHRNKSYGRGKQQCSD